MNNMIKICSYNIKKCNSAKIKKYINTLQNLIILCDIVFLQELQSSITDDDIQKLYNTDTYCHKLSYLVGRNKYKEKYCYIYNKQKLNYIDSYIFDDNDFLNIDCFDRNPYVIKFINNNINFHIIGCHTKPSDALNECNMIDNIAEYISKKEKCILKDSNIIMLGDFNASGCYVKKDSKLDLCTNKNFYQITSNIMDTMVSKKSNNSYDRIFCTNGMKKYFVCTGVVNMEDLFNMTYDEIFKLSDHYPIEVTFYFV